MIDPLDEIQALLDLGRDADAADAARRVLAARPDDPDVLRLYAIALLEDDPHTAAGVIRRATGLRPNDPDMMLTTALVQWRIGDPLTALRAVDAAVELAPSSPRPHLLRAAILHSNAAGIRGKSKQRQLADARSSAQRAVSMAPNLAEAHGMLALVELEDRNHDEARRHAEEALRLDPEQGHARTVLGEVAEYRGDVATAGDHYVAAARTGSASGMRRLAGVGGAEQRDSRLELVALAIGGIVVAAIVSGFNRQLGLVVYLVLAAALGWYAIVGRASMRRRGLSDDARSARDDHRDMGGEP